MSKPQDTDWTRRKLLAAAGQGLVAAAAVGAALAPAEAQQPGTPPQGGKMQSLPAPIQLDEINAPTEQKHGPTPTPMPPDQRVGFAVVGLGHLALNQILPAFGECKRAKLTALVSGDKAKGMQVASEYGVPASGVYDYASYDQLKNNPAVDVIYIVLPNGLHEEYTVRGAAAGKHILCEKPMANNPQQAQHMIDACRAAQVKLMIAYRIQYEPNNKLAQQWVRDRQFGRVKVIEAVNGQNQGDPNQWRQKKALTGGGSLPDVGLYDLNTTRYLLGEEPYEVLGTTYATPGDPRFREVEETVLWQMRFPSGALFNGTTGYGFHESRRYRVLAEKGWFGLDPAFSYSNLRMELSQAQGMAEYRQTPSLDPKNQFALEMDHMAECVRQNKTPYTPGEEGLQDHRIMAAIYESAHAGKAVHLPRIETLDTFRGKDRYETRTQS